MRILPFGEVDAAFAADYGEGDRTLVGWREHLGGDHAARLHAIAGCASLWRLIEREPEGRG